MATQPVDQFLARLTEKLRGHYKLHEPIYYIAHYAVKNPEFTRRTRLPEAATLEGNAINKRITLQLTHFPKIDQANASNLAFLISTYHYDDPNNYKRQTPFCIEVLHCANTPRRQDEYPFRIRAPTGKQKWAQETREQIETLAAQLEKFGLQNSSHLPEGQEKFKPITRQIEH